MKKIKLKDNKRPYSNNEELNKSLSIEIKKAFNDVFLNDLIKNIINVFNKFDPKKNDQLKFYQEDNIHLKDRIKNLEKDLFIVRLLFVALILVLLVYVFFNFFILK